MYECSVRSTYISVKLCCRPAAEINLIKCMRTCRSRRPLLLLLHFFFFHTNSWNAQSILSSKPGMFNSKTIKLTSLSSLVHKSTDTDTHIARICQALFFPSILLKTGKLFVVEYTRHLLPAKSIASSSSNSRRAIAAQFTSNYQSFSSV